MQPLHYEILLVCNFPKTLVEAKYFNLDSKYDQCMSSIYKYLVEDEFKWKYGKYDVKVEFEVAVYWTLNVSKI